MSEFYIRSSTELVLRNQEGFDVLTVADHPREKDAHCLWELVPYFDDRLNYSGYAIKSKLDGRFIRACETMLNGGGVSMVTEDKLDSWAMWEVQRMGWNNDNRVIIIAYSSYYSSEQRDLSLYGASGWKAGAQVITYQWVAGVNQMWVLETATL